MTDRWRADLLVALHRDLLEHEARLSSLLEPLLARERLGGPTASTAHTAPAAPGDRIRLTEREVQILELLVKGHTNRQIGAQLQVGAATIRNRLGLIYQKLGVMTRTQAAVRAIELGTLRSRSSSPPQPTATSITRIR